jgi:nickel transport protein
VKKILCTALIAPVLAFSSGVLAHRVNLFAWVEDGSVQTESKFSGGSKARGARMTATDRVTGAVIASGTTDEQGAWRFALTDEMRRAAHDIVIVIDAGEGHRNEWTVPAGDFSQTSAAGRPVQQAAPAPQPAAAASGEAASGLTEAQIEAAVSRALDARLAPVMRALAESAGQGPKLSEIVGGIGWLVGLFGIAAYFRRKRGE